MDFQHWEEVEWPSAGVSVLNVALKLPHRRWDHRQRGKLMHHAERREEELARALLRPLKPKSHEAHVTSH